MAWRLEETLNLPRLLLETPSMEKQNVWISCRRGQGHTMDTMYIKFLCLFVLSLVHLLQYFHIVLRDEATFALQLSFQPAGLTRRSHCGVKSHTRNTNRCVNDGNELKAINEIIIYLLKKNKKRRHGTWHDWLREPDLSIFNALSQFRRATDSDSKATDLYFYVDTHTQNILYTVLCRSIATRMLFLCTTLRSLLTH